MPYSRWTMNREDNPDSLSCEQDIAIAPRNEDDGSLGARFARSLREVAGSEDVGLGLPAATLAPGDGNVSRLNARYARSLREVADNDIPVPGGEGGCLCVLAQYAHEAGLSDHLEPFASGASLAERLAANPLLMAPMAGVSDAAYRIMARAGGAALAYSEMVSVAGMHYGGKKTWDLAIPDDSEPDLAVQLFGADPEHFREAAAATCEKLGRRLALLDINMACPMPKVTKNGAGSALLDDPERAAKIVAACVSEANVPVTAKIRRGRRMGEEVAPEFARVLEDAGASAIAVHGRFANQLYRGEASWESVCRVVDAVDIPVIGSGDVMSNGDAVRMMKKTGCTAVMVARGSYGNPWIFRGIEPTARMRIAAFACHVRLLDATHAHMARARSLAGWYFRGMPHAAAWRNKAMGCKTKDDYLELANELVEQ